MSAPLALHPDRLFPADAGTRFIARRLFAQVETLPIISPHGHTDAKWFALNERFADPVATFLTPDHYVLRMLYSQGVGMEELGVAGSDRSPAEHQQAWRTFASHYRLFRGTPTGLWLDWVFAELFGLDRRLDETTAELYWDTIVRRLTEPGFTPRALFDRFGLEVLATTDAATDALEWHEAIASGEWKRRVLPTFRPDGVTDPQAPGFGRNIERLSELTGVDCDGYAGYLDALRSRRGHFAARGATATDHGPPSARTADLSPVDAAALYARVRRSPSAADVELFRAQMLTEMAAMSLDDGLVMQLHPGAFRNHNPALHARFGPDRGGDVPRTVTFVDALKPLLDRFGNDARLTLVLFTLDETTFSRELAPLAGHYPALRLGAPWWFLDAPEAMLRFRESATETAGFYNTVGFTDDTRAFFSIPARHDVARRIDCSYLARLVAEHRLGENEAGEIAVDLAYNLPKQSYRL